MQEQEDDQHSEACAFKNRMLDVVDALLDKFGLIEREIEAQVGRQGGFELGDIFAYRLGCFERIRAARFANFNRNTTRAVVGGKAGFLAFGVAHGGDHAQRDRRNALASDDDTLEIRRILEFALYTHQAFGPVADEEAGSLVLVLAADRSHHLFDAYAVSRHFVGIEANRHFALHGTGDFDGADTVGTLQALNNQLIGKIG